MSAQSPPLTEILTKLGDDWSIVKNRFDRCQSKGCVVDENRWEALHNHSFPWVLKWVTVRTGISSDRLRKAALMHFEGCMKVVEKLCLLDEKRQTEKLWERLVKECPSVLRQAGLMPEKPTGEPPLPPPAKPGKAKGRGGRSKDPNTQARNKKVCADFAKGLTVDKVTEKYGISADLARNIKSQGNKAKNNTPGNRQS